MRKTKPNQNLNFKKNCTGSLIPPGGPAGALEVNLQFSYPKFIYILSDALLWQNLPH